MNVLILGGKSNFGAHLTQYMTEKGHSTISVGRPVVDFKSGWMKIVYSLILAGFGGPENLHVVVINVYDHDVGYEDTQENVFTSLWALLKDKPVTIVVIGSMPVVPAYVMSRFSKAKQDLANTLLRAATVQRTCKLVLVEPNILENNKFAEHGPYTTFRELADLVYYGIQAPMSFLRLGCVGNNRKSENNNAQPN